MEALPALETAVDAALTDRRRVGYFDSAWLEPAGNWANSVWEAAVRLGPLAPDEADRRLMARAAQAPVFVCGAPRSGTTLMRDLLDSHPALAVLPAEGRWFGNWEAKLADDPDALGTWTREWLQRFANPMNQPPYWLLGRGGAGDPHLRFARAMLGWAAAQGSPNLLVTLALAYAATRPGKAEIRHWVDKTPGYETRLEAIWSRFPVARVIVMLRRPEAIAASYVTGLVRSGARAASTHAMLRNVARSHAATRRALTAMPAGRLLIVSYEALVTDRAGMMAHVADFLGIGWHDALLRQSIAGYEAEPNTSFYGMARTGFRPASARERLWLALARHRHRSLAATMLGGGQPALLQHEDTVANG